MSGLNNCIRVNETLKNGFRHKGHTLIHQVLNASEIPAYRNMINAAAYKFNTEKHPLNKRDTFGKAFSQVMNLREFDDYVKKFM